MKGKWYFARGPHTKDTLEDIAVDDPGYLLWWVNGTRSHQFTDSEFYALRDVINDYGLEKAEKKRKKNARTG